jgi:undecaprenyl-diphosphatase
VIHADRYLERWVVHHRAEWLNPVFVWLSRFGEYGAVWLVLGLVLALLWRKPWLFPAVVAADFVAQGLSSVMRSGIDRDRPPLRYPSPEPLVAVPGSHSFPSGHTTSSFACATVLSFASPRFAPLFYLLALAIGFSRVYDGVHYPLDVLGGAALGVLIGLGIVLALRRLLGEGALLPRS